MVSAFVLAVLIQGQAQTGLITLDHSAASAPVIVQALAKATGDDLSCAPALQNRILFVHVTDVEKQEIYDRIAAETGGEWIKESSGRLFLRPSSKASASERAALEARKKAIAEYLAKCAADTAKVVDEKQALADLRSRNQFMEDSQSGAVSDTGYRQFQSAENRLPEGRLKSAIISKLDAATLAAIPKGGRIVYSTQPTPMQLRLDGEWIKQRISAFNQENARLGSALRKADGVPDDPQQLIQSDPDYSEKMSRYFGFETIDADRLSMVHVVVERGEESYESESLNVSVRTWMDKESWPRSFDGSINLMEEPQDIPDNQPDFEASIKRDPDEPKFELGEESKILMSWSEESPKKHPELFAKVMRPDLHEPLAWMPSEFLRHWTVVEKRSLICDVPEAMMSFTQGGMPDNYSVSKLMRMMDKGGYMDVEWSDRWLTLRPGRRMPQAARTDRVALAKLMAALATKPELDLDDLADFLGAGGTTDLAGAMAWARLAGPSRIPYLDPSSLRALRLYGSLSLSQKQALKRGETLTFGSLGPAAKKHAEMMVYGARSVLTRERESAPQDQPDEADSVMYGGSDMGMEPTTLVPSGIPSGAILSLGAGRFTMIYSYESATQPADEGWAQSPESAGSQAFYSSRPDLFPWVRDQQHRAFFRLGSMTATRLELRPTAGVIARAVFRSETRPSSGPAVPIDKMPEEIRAKFKKGYARAEAGSKDAQPGDYGGAPKKNIP